MREQIVAQGDSFWQNLTIPLCVEMFSPEEWNAPFFSRIPEGLLHLTTAEIQLMVVKKDENFTQEAVFASFAPNAGKG